MGSQSEPGTGPGIQSLLQSSYYFLCQRDFTQSLKCADKAQESNPSHPDPPRMIAISAVLSAIRTESTDWYSILNLPRFVDDTNLIRTRFDSLTNLLNPEKNPYPFATEARGWVSKAGSILCNPDSKAQFDKELKIKQNKAESGGGTFWTLCPYCYFMYEYEKVYEDCVLKCQNSKCRRAFTAVQVAEGAAPPPQVVEKGEYFCYGFSPLGPENGSGGDSGEGDGKKWWAPFVSMGSGSDPGQGGVNENMAEVRTDKELKSGKTDEFIEISDGEMEVKKRADGNGENGGKVMMKRKKMAAKGKKKLMGKGIRVMEML
ncbi:hypothetical protein ACH5RR_012192 [Cinchona calisaya]|uniref:J domain-containing protein n=1 Tax=Cinchona calisaya TaxID=153742 RepID=A0ABD3A6Z4_9GENT